jgi:uncharacterized membrane protein YhaH (DUF805 family)/cold shock CspA family protein
LSSGEIIYFDSQRGTGFISGADGNRYVFDATDLVADAAVAKGTKVAFEPEADRARRITPQIRGQAARQPASAEDAATHDVGHIAEPAVMPGLLSYFRYCVTTGYVRFRGRARRREYWSFVFVSLIGFAIVGGVGFAAGTALGYNEADEPRFAGAFLGVFWLFLFLPSLALLVRRLHDIGLSGWFILLGFVPMVGSLIILVFTLVGSQKHENKWGPVPTGVHVS